MKVQVFPAVLPAVLPLVSSKPRHWPQSVKVQQDRDAESIETCFIWIEVEIAMQATVIIIRINPADVQV